MLYCPNCRSREIFPIVGGYAGQIYLCKKCGYRGSFVLEIDEEDACQATEKEKNDQT